MYRSASSCVHDRFIEVVQEALSDFLDIDYLIQLMPDCHGSQIIDLTS